MVTTEEKKSMIRRLDKFGGSVLTDLFISNKENGIKEGFRRIALIVGAYAAAWSLNNGMDMQQLMSISMKDMTFDIIAVLTVVSVSATYFIVVATLVRILGWAVDGFVKGN